MKSYLSLIPISARVHKKQSRMTILCIVLAVFLVTGIFSMADMGIRMEENNAIRKHGYWHIMLKNISHEDSEIFRLRPDVAAMTWYDTINYKIDKDYYVGNKKAALCGSDETFVTDMWDCLAEGKFPQNEGEALVSLNTKNIIGIDVGDKVTLNTPSRDLEYTVTGFIDETSSDLYDAVILVVNRQTFENACEFLDSKDSNPAYYVRFKDHMNLRKVIAEIKEHYGFNDENLSENTALLGITGFSSDSYMVGLYGTAAVLFLLVLTAGILMIAGSMNSNIAGRTEFFGMLRCIGANKKQIIRFVTLEAINWCKVAVPLGVVLGTLVTWILCAVLKFSVGGELANIPVFGVSAVGITSGIIMGILTVLLAARAPARRAAKVSPTTAVSGSASNIKSIRHGANTRFLKIETALGVHHAVSAKKNLILMTCSFALSIILFLGFSAMVDWTHRALNPLRDDAPDISIISNDQLCSVDRNLINEIESKPEVKRAFGRMYVGEIPVSSDKNIEKIDLISYGKYEFDWAESEILRGDLSRVAKDRKCMLAVYDESNPLDVGDKIKINNREIEVTGILSQDGRFDVSEGIPMMICSEETFREITGIDNYRVIDIQLEKNATDVTVNEIRSMAGNEHTFSDRRESNKEITATYLAFSLLVYGFLGIIAIIALFNIMNSISMSVSARIKQYGAMLAVGMSRKQVTKMITAEALTYAFCGCLVGCFVGIPLNKLVFEAFITEYFGDPWIVPFVPVVIIILFIVTASAIAVYAPSKRIRNMSIIDTIHSN